MELIQYLDAHTHLNDEIFNDDLAQVIQRLYDHNIIYCNLVGVEYAAHQKSLQMKKEHPFFDITCGLHPQMIMEYSQEDIDYFYQQAFSDEVICIGEIGLDYHWYPETKEVQIEHFIRQIELANHVKKPIMIHSRDAIQDTYDVLKHHRPQYGCIMHSFSGSWEMAQRYLDLDCILSFGGPVTFKNAKVPKEVVTKTPLDYLLSETDSPYLTPSPYRGKRNESSYVVYVVEMMAQLKQLPVAQVAQKIIENYQRVFKKN